MSKRKVDTSLVPEVLLGLILIVLVFIASMYIPERVSVLDKKCKKCRYV